MRWSAEQNSETQTMSLSSRTSRRRHGFTLVELLVVIAIIGTLVALLLPAVQAARENARSAKCNAQLGELAKAMVAYETSKGNFPGYAQFVKQDQTHWARVVPNNQKVSVGSTTNKNQAVPLAWAAMLLRNIERQDLWDRIVSTDVTLTDEAKEVRPIDVFICPSDTDATSVGDRPALSYIANTGAWDYDGNEFQYGPAQGLGDTAENGVMFNLAEWERRGKKGPTTRVSGIRDGANMTIMLSENIHRMYEGASPGGPPLFTWLYGAWPQVGLEQQVGMVWVVPSGGTSPQAGNAVENQEAINRNRDDLVDFDPSIPRFARPASNHGSGVNVAFCDAHTKFLRDDIDYIVYQQLLTTNGAKCEDPLGYSPDTSAASPAIRAFRTASPLSEEDYQ